jgi:hypothetical protein
MRTLAREDDIHYLPYVGRRLAAAGNLQVLAELMEVSETFASQLMPSLASAGDVDAAAALLDQLAASLAAGHSMDRLELEWLSGVQHASLLGQLFAAVRAALGAGEDRSITVLSALISAIRRIGGAEAVAQYDELMVSSDEPSFRFMRANREEVVQDELKRAGRRAAQDTAALLGLPFLNEAELPT